MIRGVRMTGDWGLGRTLLLTGPSRLRAASQRALMQEAQYLRRELVQGMRSQAPGGRPYAPLAQSTLERRKRAGRSGGKILIVTGDLRNSINVTQRQNEVFVGILRTARGRDGQTMVNIAEVHEEGSRDGRIPARPTFGPVFQQWSKDARDRFFARVGQNLGGAYGSIPGLVPK